MAPAQSCWWEKRWALAVVTLLTLAPLIWPSIPPLVDLPGHMGRYRVQLNGNTSILHQYYDFRWALIGNLGVDLLIVPLSKIFGLELGVKLIVMAIPAMTVAGLLWVAREVHDRIPPTAFFALPLAYGYPFQLGFVNYCLAMALALLAFGLWLRLGRAGRIGLRTAAFVPIAWLLWIAHSFGWAAFGLFAWGAELARLRAAGHGWWRAIARAILLCLPLALPIVAILSQAQSGTRLGLDDWFNWPAKIQWLVSVLRDRWILLDIASLGILALLLYVAARDRTLGFAPLIGIPALLATAAFVLLPRLALAGAYVDMRIAPYALALGLIAIRPIGNARAAQTLALAGLVFFTVRMCAATASFALHDAEYERALGGLEALPRGASVLSLVARPCGGSWDTPRMDHIPAMAIVRRDAFTNDQWTIKGQQLISIRAPFVAPYDRDPSQLVYPRSCPSIGSRFDAAIAGFDRRGFDYVWTIGFPVGNVHARDLTPIWNDDTSALYRVGADTQHP